MCTNCGGMDGWYTYKINRDTIWYPGSFFYFVDDDSDQYNNSNELDEFLAGFSKEAVNG